MLAGELEAPHRSFSDVPRDLEAICLKCLEKQPSRRYARASELATDLRRFLDGAPTEARPLGLAGRTARWIRRRPALAALLLLSAFTVVSLLSGSTLYSFRVVSDNAELNRRQTEIKQHQETLQKHLYVADVALAATAYQRNNLLQARALSARHVPSGQNPDRRSFAWHLLDQLCHRERLVLQGHQADVFTVAYSPDGKLLATCGIDRTVRLWNPMDGRLLFTSPLHDVELSHLVFSPSGKQLAASDHRGIVRIYDLSVTVRTTQPLLAKELNVGREIWGLALSSNDELLALATFGGIEVRSLSRGVVQSWPTSGDAVRAVVFSPDGNRAFLRMSTAFTWRRSRQASAIIFPTITWAGSIL